MAESMQMIDILLVEDNPGDVRLTQEAFREGMLLNNFHVVIDEGRGHGSRKALLSAVARKAPFASLRAGSGRGSNPNLTANLLKWRLSNG